MKVNNLANIAYMAHKTALDGTILRFPFEMEEILKKGLDDFHKPEDFSLSLSACFGEIGVLMSGGLDSIACYLMAKQQNKKVKCFYYDIGQPYKEKELKAISKIVEEDELVIISDFKLKSKGKKYDWGDFILPLRNMVLILDAAERIYGGQIYFGVVEGELKKNGCGDKGIDFISEISKLLQSYPFPVTLEMPLKNMTKGEIVKWYLDNGYKKELHLTMSCLKEEEGHCGRCQSCLKKYLAFLYNGEELKTNSDVRLLKDLIEMYSKRTSENNVGEKYVKEMKDSINLL